MTLASIRILVVGGIVGIGIWVLAVIGALSVAHTIGAGEPSPSIQPLLAIGDDTTIEDPSTLPRYPGSARTEVRRERFGTEFVTRMAYVTADPADAVRTWYAGMAGDHGWEIRGADLLRGEWTLRLAADRRSATLEVSAIGDLTEIEIELVDAIWVRGSESGR